MYGDGVELEKTKALARTLQVDDVVTFKAGMPNAEILREMSKHSVFLFTSDKREGWGAVANESMANGCILIASDEIGSAPFLINDGHNGFLFKSRSVDSLTEKVEWVLQHPERLGQMRQNAQQTMFEIWSPKHAAENLLRLIDDIENNKPYSVMEGPASIAPLL